MKKLLTVLFACLFMAGLAFADSNYTSENAVILGPNMGGEGITPPVEIIKISVGSEDNAIVGTVMTWNIDQSTDGQGLGFVVDICERSASTDISVNTATDSRGYGPYAGVMVTTASIDVAQTNAGGTGGITFDVTDVTGYSSAQGYMAIRGYCDALMRDADSTLGENLVLVGASTNAGPGYFQTTAAADGSGGCDVQSLTSLSEDIGLLLEDPAANGLARVWLR